MGVLVKEIVLKKRNGLFMGVFTGVFVLFITLMIVVMFYGLLFDNHEGERIDEYLMFIFPLSIFWILFAQLSLWNLKGRNVIRLYEDRITLKNAGALIHMKEKEFKIAKPLRVELRDIRDDMNWTILYGVGGDKLIIKGYDGQKNFGQGLNTVEAQDIADEMNAFISERAG